MLHAGVLNEILQGLDTFAFPRVAALEVGSFELLCLALKWRFFPPGDVLQNVVAVDVLPAVVRGIEIENISFDSVYQRVQVFVVDIAVVAETQEQDLEVKFFIDVGIDAMFSLVVVALLSQMLEKRVVLSDSVSHFVYGIDKARKKNAVLLLRADAVSVKIFDPCAYGIDPPGVVVRKIGPSEVLIDVALDRAHLVEPIYEPGELIGTCVVLRCFEEGPIDDVVGVQQVVGDDPAGEFSEVMGHDTCSGKSIDKGAYGPGLRADSPFEKIEETELRAQILAILDIQGVGHLTYRLSEDRAH